MTLIYIRAYSTYFYIGAQFNYSESQAYKIINQVINFLIDSNVFIKNQDADFFAIKCAFRIYYRCNRMYYS